jgi:hypothetical protein
MGQDGRGKDRRGATWMIRHGRVRRGRQGGFPVRFDLGGARRGSNMARPDWIRPV